MELLGIYEIADLAKVTPQAVSNWVVRKLDFPRPIANLASGPIWNGTEIREWLIEAGVLQSTDSGSNQAVQFVKGNEYTHDQVCSLGGEPQSYLPQRNNRIVCARLTQEMNSDPHGDLMSRTPYQVLVGDKPKVRAKAEVLEKQEGPIPVFVKIAPNRWKYHGEMELVSYRRDRDFIEKKAMIVGRVDPVVGVLIFKDCN